LGVIWRDDNTFHFEVSEPIPEGMPSVSSIGGAPYSEALGTVPSSKEDGAVSQIIWRDDYGEVGVVGILNLGQPSPEALPGFAAIPGAVKSILAYRKDGSIFAIPWGDLNCPDGTVYSFTLWCTNG